MKKLENNHSKAPLKRKAHKEEYSRKRQKMNSIMMMIGNSYYKRKLCYKNKNHNTILMKKL